MSRLSSSNIIIFRKRLLSYSETFIADQGLKLQYRKPVYCGYETDQSGIKLISGAELILLDQLSRFPRLAKLKFRHHFGAPKSWVDALQKSSPALIHAHFFNDGLDAIKLGRELKIPVITTLHGHDITKHSGAGKSTTKRFFSQVHKVIAVSDFIAKHTLARGCPEEKLIKHSIGIDIDRFSQPKQESDHPSILFVGRLVEKKGCTYLLQALDRISTKFPDLTLTIVGNGKLLPPLRQQAADCRLKVEFVGTEAASSIRDRLARSWLFVAPSITAHNGDAEGLGMVFLEAQALRTPVVSFRSGGVVEAVEDQKTGLLCEEKDVEALADNITTLLENATMRKSMGDLGRKRVEQKFNIRLQCEKLENIYDNLLAGKS